MCRVTWFIKYRHLAVYHPALARPSPSLTFDPRLTRVHRKGPEVHFFRVSLYVSGSLLDQILVEGTFAKLGHTYLSKKASVDRLQSTSSSRILEHAFPSAVLLQGPR